MREDYFGTQKLGHFEKWGPQFFLEQWRYIGKFGNFWKVRLFFARFEHLQNKVRTNSAIIDVYREWGNIGQ